MKHEIDGRIIEFEENLLDDGSLEISWAANNSRDWKQILYLIKSSIKQGERAYRSETKTWVINSSQIPIYENIKLSVLDQDEEKLGEVNESLDDEILARLMETNLKRLSNSMRKRAIFAIKAALELIDAPVEYSISESRFGAWNEDEQVWMYEDGRYSSISPTERDNRTIQLSYKRLQAAYNHYGKELDDFANPNIQENWKHYFRLEMLKKYDNRCYICFSTPEKTSQLHMHRVNPGKNGGQYVEDNVVVLCVGCHRKYEGESWDTIRKISYKAQDDD